MSARTYPDNYFDAAELRLLDGYKVGNIFVVECCYCGAQHTHDFGTTDPDNPAITGRTAPCNGRPYTIRWD
jgi:hypothetical protein